MLSAPRLINLLDYDPKGLAEFFAQYGEKPFRATQVIKWIYQQGVVDIDAMTNLSKALRAQLKVIAEIRLPQISSCQDSDDGSRKWLMQLEDGNCVEAVYIPEKDRGTLCVSSQVGCILNCSFCSTGRQGFNRNLTTAEIIGQVWMAASELGQFATPDARHITNVVMMGMGEPLLNFDNVVKAMNLMMDDFSFGLSKRRVTLSTAGVVPGLDQLAAVTDVALAVSLHATTDALRDELVPINKKYPIAELLAACLRYVEAGTRRRITFEYVMLDGINDSPEQARELARLLRDLPAKINLIPFNPFPGTQYTTSSPEAVRRFQDILAAAGYTVVVRKTRGDDIDAACGQLAGKVQDRTRRSFRLQQQAAGGAV